MAPILGEAANSEEADRTARRDCWTNLLGTEKEQRHQTVPAVVVLLPVLLLAHTDNLVPPNPAEKSSLGAPSEVDRTLAAAPVLLLSLRVVEDRHWLASGPLRDLSPSSEDESSS